MDFGPAGMQRYTGKMLTGAVVYMPVVLKRFRLCVDNRDTLSFLVAAAQNLHKLN